MIEGARRILKSVFGYDRFISLQEEVITSVLGGNDCLAVMPTGGGKSLCYQIPALMLDGLTVVVSPLIALMKDQVDALTQLDVPAVLLNSTLTPEQYRRGVARIRGGEARLLYVAPETLTRGPMLALLDSIHVSCLAIDEAHCISEWGHDFRPEYRQLAEVRARIPQAICLALTATATQRVRKDIKESLGFDESSEFVASFNRDNLLLRVIPKERPLNQAVELLRKYPNDPGIIYCSTRKQVDALCEVLGEKGFSVCPYHAGLSDHERERNQDRFVRDEVGLIVATVAFGMGIDKSNIRFVLHYDLPKNIEGYYQEIGRAGRDGLQAECVLLFSYGDLHKVKYFIAQKEGIEQRAASLQLSLMLKFAESEVCRRIPLLAYFGETFPHERCGLCDNCLAGERDLKDITVPAQKFLSCVKRVGERFGSTHIIEVLRGSKSDKVLRFGHDTLSTHGIGRELSRRQWQQIARQLLHKGLMIQDADVGRLSLTPKAWDVLRGSEPVFGRLDEVEEPTKPPEKSSAAGEISYDKELFETLRKKRKELADAANVPPYVVFSDKSLAEMAAYLPRTPDAMLSIHGVGRAKLDRYGSVFIDLIEDYCRAHPVEAEPVEVVARRQEERGTVRRMRELAVGRAFNSGESIESLARTHDVRETRILDYLLSYLQEGHSLRAEQFLPFLARSEHELNRVLKAFEAEGPEMLRPIFDALNGEVSYDDLRLLRLYYLSLRSPMEASGAPDRSGLYTIGHSSHPIEQFIDLLKMHAITAVGDVRSSPYSRYNPQFNRETLQTALKTHAIAYVYLGELGPRSNDPSCYVNGKVQYDRLAAAEAFKRGIERLFTGMKTYRIALMCAEKDPITCHRMILICRALRSEPVEIRHILEDGRVESLHDAEMRLLQVLKMDQPRLIDEVGNMIPRAYDIQARRIAYVRDEAVMEEDDPDLEREE
ncbi:MAG: DNA helicase RecQ [Syntrophobacteraceae bacterium]